MRQVDRSSVERPAIYESPQLAEEFDRLREFYQQRVERGHLQVRSPLAKAVPYRDEFLVGARSLFLGKCAYCEQHVEGPRPQQKRQKLQKTAVGLVAELDFFRPHSEATGEDGSADPDHYWWLAFEWGNHYLACPNCLRYKRTHFPVVGERLDYNPRQKAFKRDKGLLLDPCHDAPHQWLEFSIDGKVSPAPHPNAATRRSFGNRDRGDSTIEILQLNRPVLVKSRKRVAARLQQGWEKFASTPTRQRAKDLEAMLSIEASHVGMGRQLVARFLFEWTPPKTTLAGSVEPLKSLLASELDTLRGRAGTRTRMPRAKKATKGVRKADEDEFDAKAGGAPVDPAPPEVSLTTVRIERVRIQNYKAIHDLSMSFQESGDIERVEFATDGEEVRQTETRAGWKMLLGENGAGKSTVLEAIACVLLGPRLLDEAVQDALDIAPHRVLRRGSRVGWVRIKFVGDETEWALKLTRNGYSFPDGAPVLGNFVRGYGATRLLPGRKPGEPNPTDGESVDVTNLFNPFVPLKDAEAWMVDDLAQHEFDYVARAIADLLDRAEDHFDAEGNLIPRTEELITLVNEHVLVDGDRLDHLSDGYRSVLAMCCDIMAAVPLGSDMEFAAGIVLVDEIGAHLHPSWKMRIVEALRRTFPTMQFVTTTHEPLCLRGLLEGETALMRRDGVGVGDGQRRVYVREDVPAPSDLRVDQLLTSSLFGLDSTIEPELDRKFSQFYYLLGRRDRTPEQDRLCDQLRRDLAQYGTLGYTRRDQKIYEIIDEHIAQERLLDPERRSADRAKLRSLNERTRKRVLDLWSYADLSRELRL